MYVFDVCLVESIDLYSPQLPSSPFLAFHSFESESHQIIFDQMLSGLSYRVKHPGVNKLGLGYSDDDFIKFEPAKGTICVVCHIHQLNINCNE